jgi:hypothetical protein
VRVTERAEFVAAVVDLVLHQQHATAAAQVPRQAAYRLDHPALMVCRTIPGVVGGPLIQAQRFQKPFLYVVVALSVHRFRSAKIAALAMAINTQSPSMLPSSSSGQPDTRPF